ncbi:hypothetical protein CYMTET_54185 [Cymbomonas tetramitiformis]|uniref:Uncharacterized protein n=1 Tax=Cymbomonas tetramitiformis TaxID=36881 RepID=A0AAE0BH73_9CHLO|nr:hypothetical protein CYMTET_54185 [Cymbomonas tetramitiformis]
MQLKKEIFKFLVPQSTLGYTDRMYLAARLQLKLQKELRRRATTNGVTPGREYFFLLIKERDNSAVLFTAVPGTMENTVLDLHGNYTKYMLDTEAKFDLHGYFGTLYVLVKDKSTDGTAYRPIQPNYTSPIALLQNRLGRAADFIASELGGSFTLGGITRNLKANVTEFNRLAGDTGSVIYAATFDVNDQFSNVDPPGYPCNQGDRGPLARDNTC